MRYLCALILTLACIQATAAESAFPVPIINPSFDLPVGPDAKLPGWNPITSSPYVPKADCTISRHGQCSLRLERTSDLAPTSPAAATVGTGQSGAIFQLAGTSVTLSGWIRTENLQGGGAGLWIRAIGGKSPAFRDLGAGASSGTNDWQRFEITLAVPADATGIFLGTHLTGTGRAWFDDLQMTVDKALRVLSPRPVASQALMTDSQLALTADAMRAIPAEWKADVLARHHPVRSLFSDDFSDLQFLKPLLAGRRVVQLGESGHGVAEFNWMKVRLIKFLHQEMGFDVLAFESNMTACDDANRAIGKMSPQAMMNSCPFSIWETEEVVPLFSYLQTAREAGKRLTLAGFDSQDSSSLNRSVVRERFRAMLDIVDPEHAGEVIKREAQMARKKKAEAGELIAYYDDLAKLLESNHEALRARFADRPEQVDMAIAEARSRASLAHGLAAREPTHSLKIRDRTMANNLDLLLDRIYPGRKIIVWAHNAHITYQKSVTSGDMKWMGEWMAERRKPEMYTIGLYMGRGAATYLSHSVYPIEPPAEGSLEAVFANAGRRISLVDFSAAEKSPGSSWIFNPIPAREWGLTPTVIKPAEAYDAILYIDTVTPPAYLPKMTISADGESRR